MRYHLLVLAATLASCHAGPVTRKISYGAAAIIGVADQLLDSGNLTDSQHMQIVHGVDTLQKSVDVAIEASKGKATTDDVAKTAGGITGIGLLILNALRNRSRKRDLEAAAKSA